MYSPKIVESNLSRVESSLGFKPHRFSLAESAQWTQRLALSDPDLPNPLPLDAECRAFIRSETALCQLDYRYFANRYFTILADPSLTGSGHSKRMTLIFRPSQELFLDRLALVEEQIADAVSRDEPTAGIRFALHKGRQVLITTICRSLLLHRLWFYPGTRGYSISINPGAVHKLYARDFDEAYKYLPWWLRPQRSSYDKDASCNFASGSFLAYETYTQMSSIAQGEQYDVGHCTECSRVPSEEWSENLFVHDLFPAFPLAPTTLLLLETTSEERGDWWHRFSEHVREGNEPGFCYQFFPWWIDPKKWVAMPPADWLPSSDTKKAISKYESMSTQLTGAPRRINRYQQYWWETRRESHRRSNTLNLFYTDYPGEPDESFQHRGTQGFSTEVVEQVRSNVLPAPAAYDLLSGDVRERLYDPGDHFPPLIHIGAKWTLQRVLPDQRDSLGLILIWHLPDPMGYYVQGCDPTVGIAGWDRQVRTSHDNKINNLAISVIRHGVIASDSSPPIDIQVAEFSSKHDAFDAARYLDALGQVYRGVSEDIHCLSCIEVNGPGLSTQREFMDKYKGRNLFQWEYLDSAAPRAVNRMGFSASPTSLEALCMKSSRLISNGGCIINSPALAMDIADAVRIYGHGHATLHVSQRKDGSHGDMLRAFMLALWAAHDWKYDSSPEPERVSADPVKSIGDFQSDSSLREPDQRSRFDAMNDYVQSLLDTPLTPEEEARLKAQGLIFDDSDLTEGDWLM